MGKILANSIFVWLILVLLSIYMFSVTDVSDTFNYFSRMVNIIVSGLMLIVVTINRIRKKS